MDFLKITQIEPMLFDRCEEIAKLCNNIDNVDNPCFFEDEIDVLNNRPILYYAVDSAEIVGFLSTYLLSNQELEICGFVLHEYRHQKIFTNLYNKLREDYKNFHFSLSIPSENVMTTGYIRSLGFKYNSTECKMLVNLDNVQSVDSKLIVIEHIDESDYSFTAILDDEEIGYCNISIVDDTAIIHDVLINSGHRHQGLGFIFMTQVLALTQKKVSKAILHVTRENVPAYNLYKKLNFSVIQQLEYYCS